MTPSSKIALCEANQNMDHRILAAEYWKDIADSRKKVKINYLRQGKVENIKSWRTKTIGDDNANSIER